MNWIRRNIPNLLTLGNLTLGVLAIEHVLTLPQGAEPKVHYYVFLAALFDLFDGAVARMLGVSSGLGTQLDSLADLITFGVLPTFIYASFYPMESWGYLILLVPACSAIRLAIFNTSSDQQDSFKGISTTAHGIFVACLPIILWKGNTGIARLLAENQELMLISAVFFSFLMVSPLRMISLKFKNKNLLENWERYLLLTGSMILILVFGFESALWIMALYLILSIITNFKGQKSITE